MDREEIGKQVWEYIDGACNVADQQRIATLIATDAVWMLEYKELSALHTSISVTVEPEQPSMRFTQNVMDTIAKANIAPATKQYINKGVIKGIAAFFIITIGSLLTYSLTIINWHETSNRNAFSGVHVDLSSVFNSSTSNIFIMACIIIALILLDTILRRRKSIGEI